MDNEDPAATIDLARGGPDASWLDRLYATEKPEWMDRDDVPLRRRQQVMRGLDRLNTVTGTYRSYARWTLEHVQDNAAPRILELGAGHGALSARLLSAHPGAEVTVSDVNPDSVRSIRAGELGQHPRATVRLLDATAIDSPDYHYDVAVFTQSMHHLPPHMVAAVLREGTRVAKTLVIIDLWRSPVFYALAVPLAPMAVPLFGFPTLHDGLISLRKAYSTSALRTLAAECGAEVHLRTRFAPPVFMVVTATGEERS